MSNQFYSVQDQVTAAISQELAHELRKQANSGGAAYNAAKQKLFLNVIKAFKHTITRVGSASKTTN